MAKYNETIVKAWFKAHGIEPVAEHCFEPSRKWRFVWYNKGKSEQCTTTAPTLTNSTTGV